MTEGRDKKGLFLPGNRFWETRASCGPNPKFKTGEELQAAVIEYFQWVDENPLHEGKMFAYEGQVTKEAMPKMRIMSIGALCVFMGISQRTWSAWKDKKSDYFRADLLPVMNWTEECIENQQLEGAASGLLNANIVARKLGLADKQESKTTTTVILQGDDADL